MKKPLRPSIYGPWVNPKGVRFEKAPPGIVLLRTLGMMPLTQPKRPNLDLKDRLVVVKKGSQSKV
jgi:hypothetical protein